MRYFTPLISAKPAKSKTAIGGTSLAATSLLLQDCVRAHTNHDHSKTEPVEPTTETPAETQDTGNEDMPQMQLKHEAQMEYGAALQDNTQNSTDNAAVEAVPASAPKTAAPASRANLLDNVGFGLGEAVLGLMVTVPFLLMSLKKQLSNT
ncbi:MAG: hypothetical protein AAFY78_21795 [Cyanobacteria bacterium J06648_16]